jgi:hypothetical protein
VKVFMGSSCRVIVPSYKRQRCLPRVAELTRNVQEEDIAEFSDEMPSART